MIVCPNCSHPNPDGAVQCEACYTALPQLMPCPSCGAQVQTDASFCGQCGYDLRATPSPSSSPPTSPLPPTQLPASPDPVAEQPSFPEPLPEPLGVSPPEPEPVAPPPPLEPIAEPPLPDPLPEAQLANPMQAHGGVRTQLQTRVARLLHVQTNVLIELPASLSVVHLGKPNDRIPPDIDLSGFPDHEIVSRVHADIRAEADAYYIEDTGSSNGTYVNNIPLPTGNRHRLRPGDRIALGKGDKVSFIFQISG